MWFLVLSPKAEKLKWFFHSKSLFFSASPPPPLWSPSQSWLQTESFILTAPAWNSQRGNENGGTNRRVTIIKLLTTKEHKNAWAKMSSSDLKPCEKNFIPCCNLPPEFSCFKDSEVNQETKISFYARNILWWQTKYKKSKSNWLFTKFLPPR